MALPAGTEHRQKAIIHFTEHQGKTALIPCLSVPLREKHQLTGQDLKAVASNGLTQMGSCFYSNDSTAGRTTSLLGSQPPGGCHVVPGPRMGQPTMWGEGDGAPGRRVTTRGAQLYL